MKGRIAIKVLVPRRIFTLRRNVKLDPQKLRAKTVKQLEELFDIAAAIAKGLIGTMTGILVGVKSPTRKT
jgi:hypothetical protein